MSEFQKFNPIKEYLKYFFILEALCFSIGSTQFDLSSFLNDTKFMPLFKEFDKLSLNGLTFNADQNKTKFNIGTFRSNPGNELEISISKKLNGFGLKLYKSMSTDTDNMMISPYSISIASLMLYYGAKTETARQIKKLLGVSGLSDEDILRLTQSQIMSLNYNDVNSGLAMNTANKIFYQNNKMIFNEYLNLLSTYFFSNATGVDFKNEATAAIKSINDWVSNQTNGKIKDLIVPGSVDDTTCLVLVNAIYFKGLWSLPFDAKDTKEEDFFVNDVGTVKASMMKLEKKKFPYLENPFGLNVKAAHFSYRGSPVTMTILLPNKDVKLKDVEQNLTADVLNQIISAQGTFSKLNVSLPKFKFEFRDKLSKYYKNLGATLMFDKDSSDFTGIGNDGPYYVSEIMHKTMIDVNEKGTEAAGATAIIMVGSSFNLKPEPIYEFKCNKPFMFIMHDGKNVLFMGKLLNPNQ